MCQHKLKACTCAVFNKDAWTAYVRAVLNKGAWEADFSRIGNGLVITGTASPILSTRGSFIGGAAVILFGIVFMVLARLQEV